MNDIIFFGKKREERSEAEEENVMIFFRTEKGMGDRS